MFCSVVQHPGSGKYGPGKTRDVVKCFPYFLSALCRFLSALQQNRAPSGLLICFMINNPIISQRIRLNFQTKLFSKGVKVASAVLCFLIKHSKMSQSQFLLEMFNYKIDWQMRRQLSIRNHTSAKFFSFEWLSREERCLLESSLNVR